MSTTERPQGQIEETFSGLMEASPDAIVIVDREGRIVLVNRHTETLFGYGRGELIGAPVEVLVPEARRPPHAAQRESYQHEPHRRPMGSGLELSGRRKDGSEFPVGISLSPVQSGGEQLITAAVRDTTAQTSTERALKLAIRELEAFTYSVSHDLRAPIRQIDGFARLLEERHGAGLEPEGLHYLNRILEGAQHMGRLVDSLLGLARIGQQDIRPIWVALDDIVQAVVEQLKSESEGREVVWRVEPLPEALCDAGLMKIAFTNLLSNALKYTRPRARAEIDIGHSCP